MRSGAELVRATQAFAQEDPRRTWGLFAATLAVHAALFATVLLVDAWPVQLAASLVLGLVGVRLFIFFHDWGHGAIFRDSRAGARAMHAVGFYTLSVPSVWKETHDYHHRHNAKLTGSWIGSYPTVSIGMYRGMTDAQRRQLRIVRHPVSMALGLLTTFFVGMCWSAWRRAPDKHRLIPAAVATWWAVFLALAWLAGPRAAVFAWMLPAIVHSAIGSYLFYAQHNFPDAVLRGRRDWCYHHAALRCSSMFDMPAWMHWFTGNIGYHHVHHLNHRIPFYRLPEAMAALPELQDPGRTSWRPADVRAALACSVWDPEAGRFLSFAEADARLDADPAAPHSEPAAAK